MYKTQRVLTQQLSGAFAEDKSFSDLHLKKEHEKTHKFLFIKKKINNIMNTTQEKSHKEK